jgi:hypothetical protein
MVWLELRLAIRRGRSVVGIVSARPIGREQGLQQVD